MLHYIINAALHHQRWIISSTLHYIINAVLYHQRCIISLTLHYIINIALYNLCTRNAVLHCQRFIVERSRCLGKLQHAMRNCILEFCPNTNSITYRPRTQWLVESIIIFEGLDNRNIFILQNKNPTGKTYNYTSVHYPKSIQVSIKHIRRSQLCLLFWFLKFNTLLFPRYLLNIYRS